MRKKILVHTMYLCIDGDSVSWNTCVLDVVDAVVVVAVRKGSGSYAN